MGSHPNVLGIGLPQNTGFDCITDRFISKRNLLEFDLVILDAKAIKNEWAEKRPGLDRSEVAHDLYGEFLLRSGDFERFAEAGRDLIVILRPLPVDGPFNLAEFGAIRLIDCEESHGENVQWVGAPEILKSIPELQLPMSYSATIEPAEELRPLYRGRRSGDLVGACYDHGSGLIIYMPPTLAWDGGGGQANLQKKTYLEGLTKLPALLRETIKGVRPSLPPWSERYILKPEAALISDLANIDAQLSALKARREQKELILLQEQQWKHLFVSHDDVLVQAVIKAFNALGIAAVPGPKVHADALATYKGRLAAVEIKGKTKSAARSDADECQVWVSELIAAQTADAEEIRTKPVIAAYRQRLAELGIELGEPEADNPQPLPVKGILIINTYRDTPLGERRADDFPHAMLDTVERNGQCALSALQLLGMVHAAREDESQKDALASMLFDTVGRLERFETWQAFFEGD
jgi:hypothetical protein